MDPAAFDALYAVLRDDLLALVNAGDAADAGAADAGGYRDRANERRKEANPDYDDALTQMVALGVEESWEWTGLRIRSSVADYTSRAPAPQIRVFEGRPRRRAATTRYRGGRAAAHSTRPY